MTRQARLFPCHNTAVHLLFRVPQAMGHPPLAPHPRGPFGSGGRRARRLRGSADRLSSCEQQRHCGMLIHYHTLVSIARPFYMGGQSTCKLITESGGSTNWCAAVVPLCLVLAYPCAPAQGFALKGGDATKGPLETMWDGQLLLPHPAFFSLREWGRGGGLWQTALAATHPRPGWVAMNELRLQHQQGDFFFLTCCTGLG